MRGIGRGEKLGILRQRVEIHGGNGATYGKRQTGSIFVDRQGAPAKSKRPHDPGVLKVETVATVSHLMEPKRDIVISGGGHYIAQ